MPLHHHCDAVASKGWVCSTTHTLGRPVHEWMYLSLANQVNHLDHPTIHPIANCTFQSYKCCVTFFANTSFPLMYTCFLAVKLIAPQCLEAFLKLFGHCKVGWHNVVFWCYCDPFPAGISSAELKLNQKRPQQNAKWIQQIIKTISAVPFDSKFHE